MSQDNECVICFEDIKDTNKCITKCNHLFCFECIFIYFQKKNECPLCRGNLISTEKYSINNKKVYDRNIIITDEIIMRNVILIANNGRLTEHNLITRNGRLANDLNEIINDENSDDEEVHDLEEVPVLI
jgi:hypothetical protein